MRIELLRHGPAVDAAEVGGDDAARVLSPSGREQVRNAADALVRLGLAPACVVSSPLPRARQTAELSVERLKNPPPILDDPRLKPGAQPSDMIAAIRAAAGSGSNEKFEVMLVGHNPDLETFLAWLVGEGPILPMKKGALAIVDVPGGADRLDRTGRGLLRTLIQGKDLQRLAKP